MATIIRVVFLFTLFLSSTAPAFAQSSWEVGTCVVNGVATIQGIECLFQNVLAVIITLIGVAVLVMLIIGSFKLLTSGGDPKAVDAGKQTVTFAIIGLVVAVSAWLILSLVARFTGVDQILRFSTQVNP